jgi:hypothetical protein
MRKAKALIQSQNSKSWSRNQACAMIAALPGQTRSWIRAYHDFMSRSWKYQRWYAHK